MLKLVEAQKPFISNFTATRTKNSITISYKDVFFFSTTSSYELTNDDIKKALWCAMWLGYFNRMDVKEILDKAGIDLPEDGWFGKDVV